MSKFFGIFEKLGTNNRNGLRDRGLYSRRKLCFSELSRPNKIDRLNWYLHQHNEKINNWQNILFSDETRMRLRSDNRLIWVLRAPGEQARLQAVRSIPKYKRGAVMFWGGIMVKTKTLLLLFNQLLLR